MVHIFMCRKSTYLLTKLAKRHSLSVLVLSFDRILEVRTLCSSLHVEIFSRNFRRPILTLQILLMFILIFYCAIYVPAKKQGSVLVLPGLWSNLRLSYRSQCLWCTLNCCSLLIEKLTFF